MPTEITLHGILSEFRKFKMYRQADRVAHLADECAKAGGKPLNLNSLNSALMTLCMYPHLRTAELTVVQDGCVNAEWHLHPDGWLDMTFRPPLIDFAGLAGTPGSGKPIIKASGTHGLHDVMIITKYFRERFANRWTPSTPV